MKVLFIHDGPILGDSNRKEFYGVHYNNEIVERYSFFGSTVSFLMRFQQIEESDAVRYSKITHPAFNFIEIPNFKSIKTFYKKSRAIKIIKDAVDKHDVVILRLPSAAGTIAFEYAKSINKPILIEMVACVYDALWNYDWRGKLLANYKMRKYQKIIKNTSHVIYVTENFLQSRYPTEGKSLGCSDVVLKDIDENILKERLTKIDEKKEQLVLGTVAAIDVPYKGQASIIKLLAQFDDLNFKYKIVGQGKPDFLNKLIDQYQLKNKVEVIGSLSHNEVFNFLDTIDVYIQPSKQEGLPRSVVEAMSRACPVIGSNIAGIPELINKDALFEAGNLASIRNTINLLNKENQIKWAKENYLKAQNYVKEILDQKRTDFYNEFKNDYNID